MVLSLRQRQQDHLRKLFYMQTLTGVPQVGIPRCTPQRREGAVAAERIELSVRFLARGPRSSGDEVASSDPPGNGRRGSSPATSGPPPNAAAAKRGRSGTADLPAVLAVRHQPRRRARRLRLWPVAAACQPAVVNSVSPRPAEKPPDASHSSCQGHSAYEVAESTQFPGRATHRLGYPPVPAALSLSGANP